MTVDVESIRNSLTKAFPPVPLVPTNEQMREYLNAREFAEGAAGKQWTDLGSEFLEFHHDALLFFDPASAKDYVPAYVLAVVRRDPVLDSLPLFVLGILTREQPAKFDSRFASLSPEQTRAIAEALKAYEMDVLGTSRQDDVTRALDSYWRRVGGENQ